MLPLSLTMHPCQHSYIIIVPVDWLELCVFLPWFHSAVAQRPALHRWWEALCRRHRVTASTDTRRGPWKSGRHSRAGTRKQNSLGTTYRHWMRHAHTYTAFHLRPLTGTHQHAWPAFKYTYNQPCPGSSHRSPSSNQGSQIFPWPAGAAQRRSSLP